MRNSIDNSVCSRIFTPLSLEYRRYRGPHGALYRKSSGARREMIQDMKFIIILPRHWAISASRRQTPHRTFSNCARAKEKQNLKKTLETAESSQIFMFRDGK
jgi:hypothetical protein